MARCPSCNAEVVAGSRWCGICRANVVKPGVGRLAPPGLRLGSYFLDVLYPVALLWLIVTLLRLSSSQESPSWSHLAVLFTSLLFFAYVLWLIVLFARGTTPGKWLLRMWVIKPQGNRADFFTMVLREFVGKLLSTSILMLGFLWILFDRENQGWHDKLASTYVVKREERPNIA